MSVVSSSARQRPPAFFPAVAGELARLIAGFNWSATALGPIENWSPQRRCIIDTILRSPVAIVTLWGPEGIMIYNDAYSIFAGKRHPGLLGSRVVEGWAEVAEFNRLVMEAALGGRTLSFSDQHFVLHRHGVPEDVWLDLDYSPIVDQYGTPEGVFAVVVETTGKVAAEQALRVSEEHYRSFVELNPAVAWTADQQGNILDFSARWLTLTGLSREEALGQGWTRAPHPEDRDRMVAHWMQAIRTGEPYDVEHRVRIADGSYLWMRSRAFARRDAGGAILRWLGTTEDISQRKALETRQALLLRLADQFRASSQPQEMIGKAAEALGSALGLDRLCYGDVDPAHDSVAVAIDWTGRPGAPPIGSLSLGAIAGDRLDALKRGATIEAGTPSHAGRQAAPAWLPGLASGLVVPLLRDGWIRGLMILGQGQPRSWRPEDIELAEDVAARTWDAVERANAAAIVRRNQARQAFLLVLGDRLRELSEARDIVETVSEAVGEHLKVSRVGYGEVEEETATIAFTTGWTDGSLAAADGRYPLACFGPDRVEDLGRGLTAIFGPTERFGAAEHLDAAEAPAQRAMLQGIGSAMAVPLIRDGHLRAVLVLGHRDPHDWSADDVALVGEVAARMWEALERARAEAALRILNATLESRVEERTAELASSEERFRTLFENAPASIFLLRVRPDRRAVFEAVNAATERFMDRAAEAIVGRDVSEATSPDDPLPARCLECAATGQPVQYEMTVKIAGEARTAECVLAPLPTPSADGQLVIGISRDITAQRRAEDQLRQAQKMEAIGQLTGGIAHDFNNLLTGIIGSLAMLQRRLDQGRTDAVARYVDLAMTSANRAAALTHRLLAFSRRQPLEAKPVDANRLVASMDDLFRRTLGESIALDIRTAPGLWLTLCDPHQLENAVLNLAINARDAMPDGGRLTVATANALTDESSAAQQPGLAAGHYVVLSVADTGLGMPPDVMARAFDPFFTTKPIGQGTGLGLSMIYGFVKQSGGYTTIASEVGKGTLVRIYLPRWQGTYEEEDEDAPHSAPRAEDGETVLLVEDDATVRDLVREVLQELGYTALEAIDGPGGLAILKSRRRIDLLVTDVGLPELNGHQLAEQARLLRPDLKVLFITGYAENAAFGNGRLDSGMQMMTKPFAVDALATRIRSMIERS